MDREQEGLTIFLWLCAALCGKGKATQLQCVGRAVAELSLILVS